jgi:hypothetical protein
MRYPSASLVIALALAAAGLAVSSQASAARIDPYKNRRIEVVKHRDGGDPSTSFKTPRRHRYRPVTLERGLTQDHHRSDANPIAIEHRQ